MSAFRFNLVLSGFLLIAGTSYAQSDAGLEPSVLTKPFVDISGQWFLAYQLTQSHDQTTNAFTLKRGYLTFKKDFNKTFSVRFTQDITIDREGSDAGNVEMRLKYLYLKMNMHWVSWLSNSWIEAGMVHRPWLDFEEKVNDFRVQGPMYLESNGILNSADFGINLVTLLGGKLSEEQIARTGHSYPGRYGSFSIGVFNGGGYHAIEQNNNKTIESRLSLRPFPDHLPGLQVNYHFVVGSGNTETSADFLLNHFILTYESRRFNFVGQFLTGKGNSYGSFFLPDLTPSAYRGYSVFGELFLYRHIISLFGQYDWFSMKDPSTDYRSKSMAGISARFLNDQKILVGADYLTTAQGNQMVYELSLEIRF